MSETLARLRRRMRGLDGAPLLNTPVLIRDQKNGSPARLYSGSEPTATFLGTGEYSTDADGYVDVYVAQNRSYTLLALSPEKSQIGFTSDVTPNDWYDPSDVTAVGSTTTNTISGVLVTGVPSVGQILTATGPLSANWQPVPSQGPVDATTITKGVIQISGDVGGTATNVTVEKIKGVSLPSVAPVSGQVLTATGPTTSAWFNPSGASVSDATSGTKGVIQLAGDLSGSGTSSAIPRVSGVQGVTFSTTPPMVGQVLTASSPITASWVNPASGTGDATSAGKGVIQLDGDLGGSGGTASLPKVSGLQGVQVSPTPPSAGQVLTASGPSSASWSSPASGTGDASTSVKGVIQLSGDIGGTSTALSVLGVRGVTVSTTSPVAGQVLTASSSSTASWETPASGSAVDATTSVKGIVRLSGDLGGTATSPSVQRINGVSLPGSPPAVGQVLMATGASTSSWQSPVSSPLATTSSTGTVTLSGDLGGSSSSPAVISVRGVSISVTPPTAGQVLQASSGVSASWASLPSPTPSDATVSAKGIVQLAGDLSGSASAPSVISIRGVSVSGVPPTTGQVLQASSGTSASWTSLTTPDATASVKGVLQLSGDIAGSSSSVSVVGVRGVSVSSTAPVGGQVLMASSSNTASWITPSVTPDATSSSTGVVQLTSDLGGSSTSPSVVGLQGVSISASAPSAGQVLTAISGNSAGWSTPTVVPDATSSVKGRIQLTGDLGGTASSPIVSGLRGVSVPLTTPTPGQVLTASSGTAASWITPVSVSDATSSVKGLIQLAGDLGGSSDSVSVLAIRGVSVGSVSPNAGQVLRANSSSSAVWQNISEAVDATSSVKGQIQLTNDLGGSSSAPTVEKIKGVTLPSSAPTVGQVLTASSASTLSWSTPPTIPVDATSSTVGLVRLSGDLSGAGSTASAPKVSGLQGVQVSSTAPSAGQVLQASSPTIASWVTMAGAVDATSSAKGQIQLAGDLSGGTASSPTVTGLRGVSLSATSPVVGQVLTAVSSSAASWSTPASVSDATSGSKGVVQLTNDLGGLASAPTVERIKGVTLPSFAPTVGQVLTASSPSTLSWSTPAAGAGDATTSAKGVIQLAGDLSGTSSSPSIAALQGVSLSATSPSSGQVLKAISASAASWQTIAEAVDATSLVKGVVQLTNDLGGTSSAPSVEKIKGVSLPSSAPNAGQVLTASSGTTLSWITPQAIPGDATSLIKGVVQLSGDLSGSASSVVVAGIRGISVSSTAPNSGQVLTATSGTAAAWSTPVLTPDATSGSKGTVQLAGDLAGQGSTAALPKVGGVQGVLISSASPSTGQVLKATSASAASWQTISEAVDATTLVKGQVRLTNDLGGTASAPSVEKIKGVSLPSSSPSTGQVLTATSSTQTSWSTPAAPPSDATTLVKGLVQLAGDLGGTSTAPSVLKINGITVSGTPSTGNILVASGTTSASWSSPSAIDSTSSAQGVVRLAGDLAGSGSVAASPRVSGIQGVQVSSTAPSAGQALVASSSTAASWVPVVSGTVVNNLTSTSTTDPLSASMGKSLNDRLLEVEDPGTIDISANVTINSGNRSSYDNKVWRFASGSFTVTLSAGVKIDAVCLTPSSGSANIAFGVGVTGNGGSATITRTSTNGLAFSIFHTGTDAYFVTGEASSFPNATSSVLGAVQLAGDLAGLGSAAASPKVGGIQGVSVSSTAPSTGQVLTATSSSTASWSTPTATADATSSVKGILQLAGDLSGSGSSSAAPKVSGLQGVTISATAPTTGQALIATSSSAAAWTTPTTATTSQFGVVRLAGDLGGTASSPSVLKLGGGISLPGSAPTIGQILVASSGTALSWSTFSPQIAPVNSSRSLNSSDDGRILDLTASALTLTIPAGLALRKVEIVVNGATVIAVSGGATVNGGTTSLTRNSSSNQVVTIYGTSTTDSYRLTGV